MSVLHWKRRSPTSPSSAARTASSTSASSAGQSINVVPISLAASPSSNGRAAADTPSSPASIAVATAPVATAPTLVAPGRTAISIDQPHATKPAQRDHLKLALDKHSYEQAQPVASASKSPGCFPLCGWPKYAVKSPVSPVSAGKPDVVVSSSPLHTLAALTLAPLGSPSHSYCVAQASPRSVKQLTSPVRSSGNSVFQRMPTFRKPHVCAPCKAMLSPVSPAKAHNLEPTSPRSPTAAAESTHTRCAVCSKASTFESQLSKSFFSPEHADGKSVAYAGLSLECYRAWFRERPMTPDTVRKTQTKRAKMLTTLQRQHRLHYHKLQDVCSELCNAFAAATCYVSVADTDLELIVGNFGTMLHFSCLPREIGMCDYTMGSPEQHLLVRSVATDPVFRENPLLQAVKAQFYLGVPIFASGVAIGAVAVMDVVARQEAPDGTALALMKQKAELMGSRVSALLLKDSRSSSFSVRMMKRRYR